MSTRTLFPPSLILAASLLMLLANASAQQAQPQQDAAEAPLVLPGDPNEITTQQMRVPPSLLYMGSNTRDTVDPFAAPIESVDTKDFQQILSEDLGIEFPEGTYARYDPRTGALAVRHHPAVVKAVHLYIEEMLKLTAENHVLVQVEIFQMPILDAVKMQRKCQAGDDHTKIWEQASRGAEDSASPIEIVTALTVVCRSGQRSKSEDISEFIYPTELDWSEQNQTIVPAAFDTRNVGTTIEIDPLIGADSFTIDLNFSLEHHTAPPTMHAVNIASPDEKTELTTAHMPEFHGKRITTQVTMHDGSTKLVGSWRPTGKAEFEQQKLMQIVFLRSVIQTVGVGNLPEGQPQK